MGRRLPCETGRIGEYYAAFRLQQAGIDVSHVAQSFDLLCTMPNGKLVALEVKSANMALKGRRSARFYMKNVTADWVAVVWLPAERMIVVPRVNINEQLMTVRADRFTPEVEADSLSAFIGAFAE